MITSSDPTDDTTPPTLPETEDVDDFALARAKLALLLPRGTHMAGAGGSGVPADAGTTNVVMTDDRAAPVEAAWTNERIPCYEGNDVQMCGNCGGKDGGSDARRK